MTNLTSKQAQKLEEVIEDSLLGYSVFYENDVSYLEARYGRIFLKGSLSQAHIDSYKSRTYATNEALDNLGKGLTAKLVKLGLLEELIITDDWKQAKDDFAWKLAPKTYVQWNWTQKTIDWAIVNNVCIEGGETGKSRGCGNCNGTGFIAAYAHVANGVCFACNGRG